MKYSNFYSDTASSLDKIVDSIYGEIELETRDRIEELINNIGFAGKNVKKISSFIAEKLSFGVKFEESITSNRKDYKLTDDELTLVANIRNLSDIFKYKAKNKEEPNFKETAEIYTILVELSDKLDEYLVYIKNIWGIVHKKILEVVIKEFRKSISFLAMNMRKQDISIGVLSVVFLSLFSSNKLSADYFDNNQTLAIEAIVRSTNELDDESNIEEIQNYVKSISPEKLEGIQRNVKGIYFELREERDINTLDNGYHAKIFDSTTHAGSDLIITNDETGATQELQLKATDSMEYINKHLNRYPDIDVLATHEVAEGHPNIMDSGIDNDDLKTDIHSTFDKLGDNNDLQFIDALTISLLLSSFRYIGKIKDNKMSSIDKKELAKSVLLSGGIGLVGSLLF